MQELLVSKSSKSAPFVPKFIPRDQKRKPLQQRPPLAKKALRELHEDWVRGLDNLLLLHDGHIKAGKSLPSTYRPMWRTTDATIATSKQGRGRPSNQMINSIKPYVTHMMYAKDMLLLPGLDDIMSGAVALDLGGNTRPLNKKMMAGLLQKIDIITAASVKEELRCSLRHAQKIATCLRIIVTLGMRRSGSWPSSALQEQQWEN